MPHWPEQGKRLAEASRGPAVPDRRVVLAAGAAGITSLALPSAAIASSGPVTPSSAVTYLSTADQLTVDRQLYAPDVLHQQRCIAGSTGSVNSGTILCSFGEVAHPAGLSIHLYADASGGVGSRLGILGYASHDADIGEAVLTSATPIVVPAGPFWVETRSDGGRTYLLTTQDLSSSGQPGWSVTAVASGAYADAYQQGGVSGIWYVITFSLGYEP